MRETWEEYVTRRRRLVDEALRRIVGESVEWPKHLHRAMTYSLFPGGKRLRPILAIAAYEAVAEVPDLSDVLPAAAAIELLHTYSLIHDDLPQMDDSDTRRGRPTNHRVHGEALAVLAGDGLQAAAFRALTDRSLYPPAVDPAALLDAAHDVAVAAGEEGMVGGQSMDLGYEGDIRSVEPLSFLFAKKTGGIIRAAVRVGARLGGATPETLADLSIYGDRIGLAFQVTDDMIDEGEVDSTASPSPVPSMVELIGIKGCREWVDRAVQDALKALENLDERAERLREIARWIPTRKE